MLSFEAALGSKGESTAVEGTEASSETEVQAALFKDFWCANQASFSGVKPGILWLLSTSGSHVACGHEGRWPSAKLNLGLGGGDGLCCGVGGGDGPCCGLGGGDGSCCGLGGGDGPCCGLGSGEAGLGGDTGKGGSSASASSSSRSGAPPQLEQVHQRGAHELEKHPH